MSGDPFIQQIQNGDVQSLRTLYEQYAPAVFRTALSYAGNREDAEEITQDVFVEVYRSAQGFRAGSSVSTWIYRITVNKSLDKLRFSKRKKRFSGNTEPLEDSTEYKLPVIQEPDAYEQEEIRMIIHHALQQLTDQQKTAFVLCFMEELPGKEAAEIMHISEKALESLKQRAKAQLRKLLEEFYEQRRKK